MKKLAFVFSIMFAIVLFSNTVSAQTDTNKTTKTTTQYSSGTFVDADGDGVCDNFKNRPMDGTGLGKGNGTCNGQGKGKGKGNGTGTCNGTGKGKGKGQGTGQNKR